MLIPDKIKSSVSALDACSRYGVEVNRSGFARCPFHNEKTPSMKIYKGDRGWHCFGCNRSGSVIDLTMGLFNLPFLAACEKLNEDFSLGLDIGKPMTRTQKIAANKEAWERQKKKQEIEQQHRVLIDEFNAAIRQVKQCEETVETKAPEDGEAEWDEAFCFALFSRTLARQRADNALEALNDFEKNMYKA